MLPRRVRGQTRKDWPYQHRRHLQHQHNLGQDMVRSEIFASRVHRQNQPSQMLPRRTRGQTRKDGPRQLRRNLQHRGDLEQDMVDKPPFEDRRTLTGGSVPPLVLAVE